VEKVLKFLEEARFLWEEDAFPLFTNLQITNYNGVVRFRGQKVEVIITSSPVSLSISLKNGSVGLISTVIYAFSLKLRREPIMVYMARDRQHTSITAHFLIDEMDIEKAKLAILLAEAFADVDISEIDFGEVKKEAERFLSEHF
jgi:hypothetical protein